MLCVKYNRSLQFIKRENVNEHTDSYKTSLTPPPPTHTHTHTHTHTQTHPHSVFSPGSWEGQGYSDKILIYSRSCQSFLDNLPHTWEFSLVLHLMSLKVSLNLWLTVPFNGKSRQYCDKFHGRVNELKPYQLREKAMKKH